MSKLKELTRAPKIPIGDAIGKMIVCPDCGQPAEVGNAAGNRSFTNVITARFWTMVRCKGSCGSKLFKITTPVQLHSEPEPEIVMKPLGQALGHNVLCPLDKCGERCRVRWDSDEGHIISCPVHQERPYSPDTMVVMA